jgi:hypothetical protein
MVFCLLLAVRNPAAHRSLIAFTAWSSLAHGVVMGYTRRKDWGGCAGGDRRGVACAGACEAGSHGPRCIVVGLHEMDGCCRGRTVEVRR